MYSKIFKKIFKIATASFFLMIVCVTLYLFFIYLNLPKLVTVEDFKPRLVSEVFDQNGEKIGEFFRERRKLVKFEDIPQDLVKAFIAAEDSEFFDHKGVDKEAIIRAMIANFKAGRKVQGGSTITQQAAKSLLLTPEKTYTRKIQELFLAKRMEAKLTKEQILYLYLNQIYFGSGAYGIKMAAETYFRKNLDELTLAEIALIAGLPKAPSRYSPILNAASAKQRQIYVLDRMLFEEFITKKEFESIKNEELVVYTHNKYKDIAPYYLETVRQYLINKIDENKLLDEGLKIKVSMSLESQIAAQESLRQGLRLVDKRSGYRGSLDNLQNQEDIDKFLRETRDVLMDKKNPIDIILPDGSVKPKPPMKTPEELGFEIPDYLQLGDTTKGVVTNVNDTLGYVTIKLSEAQGMIDIESMKWAGEPNEKVKWDRREISKPSSALKKGDVVEVKITSKKFDYSRILPKLSKPNEEAFYFKNYLDLELEQTPILQASLLSFDLKTKDVIAMVGGYDFEKSKFNRAIQALRQPGSSFKPIVYAAALDKSFTPSSVIIDSPVVYKDELATELEFTENEPADESVTTTTAWKPKNYNARFSGDILFRNALKKSQNIPTIKIMQQIGIDWIATYARRLGLYSNLNMDLSMGLGSSSVSLYEMTKAFAHFANLGRRFSPVLIKEVIEKDNVIGNNVLVDDRFEEKIHPIEQQFEHKRLQFLELNQNENTEDSDVTQNKNKPNIFFENPDQLISPQIAYIMTSLLKAVVEEPGGTGRRALGLGRTSAGKTGTTNGYFDAWYIGYTPQIITGVWLGFDNEKTIGFGETGAISALPIWLEYMKKVHQDLPNIEFSVPEKIVFASIDNETGLLASSESSHVIKQPFIEGSEPKESLKQTDDSTDFFKQDLYD